MKTVLITGASGFIGKRYLENNIAQSNLKTISLRSKKIEDISLKNVDTIFHLAGKAHQMQKIDAQIYFDVNYKLTEQLAKKAKAAGVEHFVFMSTIKVYGEKTKGETLNEHTDCLPVDPYGKSKLAAEKALRGLEDANFRVAIIRSPLVYGPGVKGNLIRLLHLADKRYPLPFKGYENQRSMVFLDNLLELTNKIVATKASGLFLAGDNAPVSTAKLIELIRKHLGRKANSFHLPNIALSLIEKSKPELYKRLYGSLVLDNTRTNQALNFKPPYSTEYGIQQMVNWFKTEVKKENE